jgi:hypothetical protein
MWIMYMVQFILNDNSLPESRSAHGKGTKTHGTAFAVRLFPKRTAKGARLIFTR